MRTSLIKIEQLERYSFKTGDPGEILLTEAQLQLDPEFAEQLDWQKKSYQVIKAYGRQQLRRQISHIDHKMFSGKKNKPFRDKIFSYFN